MKILQEIKAPQESVNDNFLNVVAIHYINNDKVKKNDILIELETSKAVLTIEADFDGYIEYCCKLDEEVKVNNTIIKIWDEPIKQLVDSNLNDVKANAQKIQTPVTINKTENSNTNIITKFSKKALEFINQNKIDTTIFKDYDFVSYEIAIGYGNSPIIKKEQNRVENNPSKNDPIEFDKTKILINKISHAKKREIEYLSAVQNAGLVSVINIDLNIEHLFQSVNQELKYFKNSVLPLIIYESARLLVKFPMFNSFYNDNGIAEYLDVNIGIAMDIDDGLKVVKIPNTNKLHLLETEEALFQLANKYIDKKLSTSDLTDITFTITDLSSFGAISFTPLINKNNSAILGVSKIDEKLNRINLSLAFDHRVTEGKIAAIFLTNLKERVESYKKSNIDIDLTNNISCFKCLKKLNEDMSEIGFINIITTKGEQKYICDTCFMKY
jgi:pyruvate/2-oxoglutarate dehydrogenase complex dihydrolipoamide acyltransferase (E2) component